MPANRSPRRPATRDYGLDLWPRHRPRPPLRPIRSRWLRRRIRRVGRRVIREERETLALLEERGD